MDNMDLRVLKWYLWIKSLEGSILYGSILYSSISGPDVPHIEPKEYLTIVTSRARQSDVITSSLELYDLSFMDILQIRNI
jgi:hypothetical protein